MPTSRGVLVVLLAASVAACSRLPDAPHPPSFSHTAGTAGLTAVAAPDTFVRGTGKPVTVTRAIATAGFTAPFVLTVQNGAADGTHRVSSAVVTLDGTVLLGPSDFGQTVAGFERGVTVGDTVRLAVELRGAPGGYLVIQLEGKRAATRFCPADVGDGASFGDFPSAIAATDTGGTILVCDGSFTVDNVAIDRPLTIRAEHPLAATINGGGFIVANVPVGTVALRDLRFTSGSIFAGVQAPWDTIVFEHNVVTVANCCAIIAQQGVAGATIILRDNQIAGGATGVRVSGSAGPIAPHAIIEHNVIGGHTFAGIQIGSGATASIRDNDISGCGSRACIYTPGGAGFLEVAGNRIASSATDMAIDLVSCGSASTCLTAITDNVITGAAPATAADSLTYGFRVAGIRVAGGPPTVLRNTIRNAWTGIQVLNGWITATDNTLDADRYGLKFQGTASAIAVHRNDITGWTTAIHSTVPLPAFSVACNWWGSAGPTTVVGVVPFVYTPYATVPIANQPSVACSPPTPPPGIVRFCPPEVGVDPTAYGSFPAAIAAASPGDTILVCDGTYSVGFASVNRPLTIRAEHPGAATLTSGGTIFDVSGVASGTNTFSDLHFTTAGSAIVAGNANPTGPAQAYDQVIIEHSTFSSSATSGWGIAVNASAVSGARVTVRNDDFTSYGGTNLYHAPAVDIVDNTFTGQRFVGVWAGDGGPLLVRNNRFTDCLGGCVEVYGVVGPVVGDISDNVIERAVGQGNSRGIAVQQMLGSVTRNVIRGVGTVVDRNNMANYAFLQGAIEVIGAATVPPVTVSGNTISGAAIGISAPTTPVNATDNTMALVMIGLHVGSAPDIHRNDITDYVTAIVNFNNLPLPAGSLTCNWWGSAAGPTTVSGTNASAYTPWSMVPIANQPGVTCP